MMKSLEEHLAEAAEFHGGDCPGQTLGVRLARAGLERIGIDDPLSGRWRKKIMVYVEIDRCAADAVMVVTGCRVGKRTLKIIDNGIMASTFVNLETGKAVRVTAREEARSLAAKYAPDETDKYEQQRLAYRVIPEEELLSFEEVEVDIPPEDMPGSPLSRVACDKCGDWIQDMREVSVGDRVLCRPCAHGGYFSRTANPKQS
jgi:formylmethanofuran dehydrogenase subunit E